MYPCSSKINSTLSVWLQRISDITLCKIYKYNWSHKICIENGGGGISYRCANEPTVRTEEMSLLASSPGRRGMLLEIGQGLIWYWGTAVVEVYGLLRLNWVTGQVLGENFWILHKRYWLWILWIGCKLWCVWRENVCFEKEGKEEDEYISKFSCSLVCYIILRISV
jgi:hypothetical protein